MSKGIDIRATTSELLFRAFLQDSAGALVTSGTTSFYLYELQMSDGSLKSYDFNDNTFKTTALTTETTSGTHQKGNNNTTNTGYWTARLATLTGFTKGNIYAARVKNTGASPTDQMREFQWGSADGDQSVDASNNLNANVNAMSNNVLTAAAINASAITNAKFASGAIDAAALASDAVDEIWAKTLTELSAVPGATAAVLDAICWLFMMSRNLRTQTSTQQKVFKNDSTTLVGTATTSDDGITNSKGKFS